MPLGTKNRYLLGLTLAASVIFVCGVALFSHLAWTALLDAFNSVSNTQEVEQQLQQLLSHLDDAETGQRGYLLTRQASYLEPYNAAVPLITRDVDRLSRLTADNSVQQARVATLYHLVDEKMRLLDVKISFEKEGYHDRALALMNSDDGRQIMQSIRAVIVAMNAEQERLLQIRENALKGRAFANRAITVSILALYLFFIGITALLLWRLSRMSTLLSICAWSKTVKYGGEWISFEKYLKDHFGIDTTHGLSPAEAEKFLRDMDDVSPQNEGRSNRAREILLDELCGFSQTSAQEEIRMKYWNAPQSVYSGLTIHWDYRRNANLLNIEIPSEELKAANLYECDADLLLSKLVGSWNLEFRHIFEEADENTLLRVIGHWHAGNRLTPPFLKICPDGKLVKRDGFHRLAVAIAAGVQRIPFWAVLDECPPGIVPIAPEENSGPYPFELTRSQGTS